MVEVPSLALRASQVLEHCDFLSLGTNDLAQYTFAADRMLAPLSDLVDPCDDAAVMAGADVPVDQPVCQGCWARHVCSHSAFVGASQEGGDDGRTPSEEHCALWRSEVEVALRFYHRLAHMDPLRVRQFFDDSLRDPGPLGRREDLGHLRMPF